MGQRSSTIPFFALLDRYSNEPLNDDDGPVMQLTLEPYGAITTAWFNFNFPWKAPASQQQ
jgi:hypothetical protein